MFISVDKLSNGLIDEEIDVVVSVVLAAAAAAAAMFAAFFDAEVIALGMAVVIEAINGCMMLAKAAVGSTTAEFASSSASTSESSCGSAAAARPLVVFALFVACYSDGCLVNCSFTQISRGCCY